jgi:hypothetical protein
MKHAIRRRLCPIVVVTIAAALTAGLALAQPANLTPNPNMKRRDVQAEIVNKMTGQYTVVVVGDLLMQDPIGKMADPKLVNVIRDADTAIGNMEATMLDRETFDGGLGGNYAPKEQAADIAAMGFDMLNGANNHTGDMGIEGMFSNIKLLDVQGIPLAGVGKNLALARGPVFQQTPKGRASLIGTLAVYAQSPQMATDRFGNMAGRPGLNPLRLTVWNVVTKEQLEQIRVMRDAVVARRGEVDYPIEVPKDDPNRVQLFTTNYMVGPKIGNYHYEFNKSDLTGILRSVRNAKEYADFNVFMIHSHAPPFAFVSFSDAHDISDFEQPLAHQVLDAGSDIYAASGMHRIKGIEIYNGKPIFYGLSGFVLHENLIEMDPRSYAQQNDDPFNPKMTAVEVGEVETDRLQTPGGLVSLMAQVKYDNGKLVEVRVYPVDLGAGKTRPWSRMGTPMTPSPAKAKEILEELQKLSAPFGTILAIEDGVGIIRP